MPESSKSSLAVFIGVALTLSTLLVYLQVQKFDFVNYDDNTYVYENAHVSNGLSRDGVVWAFTSGHASNWHPLTWLSHMLDCRLFGVNPGWMHMVNVLLHLANTLLLFAVLKKMTGSLWPSAFVAAAFALHPMHVESVAWIAERKDVLSTFFLLLTLAAYTGYVRKPTAYRYLASLALFACGLMAKPMLVTLPLLLLLLDYWPLNRFDAGGSKRVLYRMVLEKVPFLTIAAASGLVTFLVQRAGGALADIAMLSLHSRAANALLSYAGYIGKLFWPEDLAVFYPFNAAALHYWQALLCALLILAVSVLVIRFGRNRKYLVVGWFWFVVALIPVIGLVQCGAQAMADRYTYIPYIGLFVMIAWGLPEALSKWPKRRVALAMAAALAIASMGIATWRQASYWRNSSTLFTHAIEAVPGNYVAYNGRGVAYAGLGRWYEAIDAYKEALGVKPDYFEAYNDRGVAYGRLGRWQEAIDDLTEAIRLRPDSPEAYNNLGLAYYGIGRRQDAIDAHRRAVDLQPDFPDARCNLANELAGQGRYDEALDQYRAALRSRPDWPAAMNELAWLISTCSEVANPDRNEAIRLADRACRLTGYKAPVFLDTLAAAYASAGRFSEAVDMANRGASLADAANQSQLKTLIQGHLACYKQGKPWVEPAARP